MMNDLQLIERAKPVLVQSKKNVEVVTAAATPNIEAGNFLMLPQYFIRFQAPKLTHTELRVMLYIFDHTLGYIDPASGGRKMRDTISRSQFLQGIKRWRDGEVVVDTGAGVSERSLDRVLEGLVKKGFIKRFNHTAGDGRNLASIYELDLERAGAAWLQSSKDSGCSDREVVEDIHAKESSTGAVPVVLAPVAAGAASVSAPAVAIKPAPTPAALREYPPQFAGVDPRNLPDTKDNYNKRKYKYNNQIQHSVVVVGRGVLVTGSVKRIKPLVTRRQQHQQQHVESGYRSVPTNPFISATPVAPDSTSPSSSALKPLSLDLRQHQQEQQEGQEPEGEMSCEKQTIAKELSEAGVSHAQALSLAGIICANGYRAGSYVGECLRYIQRQTGVKSRVGLLVYLVKTNWQPPSTTNTHEQLYRQGQGLGKVLDNREKILRSWASYYSVEESNAEKSSEMVVLSSDNNSSTEGTSSEGQPQQQEQEQSEKNITAIPTLESCHQAWLKVCKTAIGDWGIAADALVGSWLGTDPDSHNTLLLHLTDPASLASIRYKLSQLIKAELGLGIDWHVLDSKNINTNALELRAVAI